MAGPKLERKSSSRWKLFKKRRKKKQEDDGAVGVKLSRSSPPTSDATSASSTGGSSRLLGRIVSKKRSKRSIIEDTDDEVYVPPERVLKPSVDVAPCKEEAPIPNKPLAVSADAVVPQAQSSPPTSPVESVSPKVDEAETESAEASVPQAVSDEIMTPPKAKNITDASKSQGNDTKAPAKPVMESTTSPHTFLNSLREAAASPTAFLSDLDPFGFPSSPTQAQDGNEKDPAEITWSSFLQPFPTSGPAKPTPTSTSERKPVATIMEKSAKGRQQSPVSTDRKSISSEASEDTAKEGKEQPTDGKLVVAQREQYSPRETERKSTAAMNTNVRDDSTETQPSPPVESSTERKPVAEIMEKATKGEQSPLPTEHKSVVTQPLSSERQPLTDIIETSTPVHQEPQHFRVVDEPTKNNKVDPPGAKSSSKSEPRDLFGEDSVFSSLTWDTTFEDLATLPSVATNEIGDAPTTDISAPTDERTNLKETETTSTLNVVLSNDARVNSSLVELSETPNAAAPSRQLADKSNELSLSHRNLLIKRMAKARMARKAHAGETGSPGGEKDAYLVASEATESTETQSLSHASTRSAPTVANGTKTTEIDKASSNLVMKKASSEKLKKRAINVAAAHSNVVRRESSSADASTVYSARKPNSGRLIDSKKIANPTVIDSVAEVPNPLQLVRKASSFDIDARGPKVGRQRSSSFELPRAQIVGSKAQEHAASSRGTDLYLKRYRRNVVDKYESIEQETEEDDPKQPSKALLVSVEDRREDEIEIVIPGEPGDALCKFEAYYSDGEVNASTASCTDVTSGDLNGDGSWGDTIMRNSSDGSTCSFATDDESRSFVTNESDTFYTNDTKSRFTDSSTLFSKDESKRTAATGDSTSYESRSYITSDYTYESRSYLADESFISRGSTTVTNDYASDECSTNIDDYYSEEDEPVDSYFWEDIAERIFAPGFRK